MSSYPDTIAANETQGPSLGSLRVKYFEEHGYMPKPEVEKELLDKYWAAIPVGQESITRSSSHDTSQTQLSLPRQQHDDCEPLQDQYPHQHDPAEMSFDGHRRLVERRLDLAPFFGPSPAEVEGGPLHLPLFGTVPEPDIDFEMPTSPFFDFALVDPYLLYESSFVNSAAQPSNYYDFPVTSHAAHLSGYYAPPPFINDNNTSAVTTQAAPARPCTPSPTTTERATPSRRQSRRTQKPKDPWTQAEVNRVIYLREVENRTWAYIQEASRDLGTHTAGSCGDKYWQVTRLYNNNNNFNNRGPKK